MTRWTERSQSLLLLGRSIDSKLGERGNYLEAGWPRTLLFEYARYARDGAMDIFENNYAHLLLAMQNERAVQRYAQNADEAER